MKKQNLKEFKIFYEMIVIPLKTKDLKFRDLEKKLLNMLDYNKKEFFKNLKKKIRMIIEEFICFKEIIEDYEKFILIYLKEFKYLKKIKDEKNKKNQNNLKIKNNLENEEKEKILKNELEFKNKIYNSKMRLMRLEEILSLLSLIIIKIQIPQMKKRKKKRFSKIINIFSHQKLSHLEQELTFWKTIESFTED